MSPALDAALAARLARAAALLLLSFTTTGIALLAWRREGVLALVGRGVLMAAALLVSGRVAGGLAGASPAWRERARLLGLAGSAMLFVVGLTLAFGAGASRMGRVAAAYAALQPLLLLLSEAGRTQGVPLANALLLAVLAVVAGGPWAAAAVVVYVTFAPLVIAFDHAARQLAPWPAAKPDVLVAVARDAARIVLPGLLVVVAALLVLPVEPGHAALVEAGRDPASPDELRAAYRRLVMLGVLAVLLVLPLVRLLRAAGAAPVAPPPETVETLVSGDEFLGGDEAVPETVEGARGRVVAAYVRVLRAAVAGGFRRRVAHTPVAIARDLAPASAELAALTGHFMDARYGARDVAEGTARDAEQQADVLVRRLQARRRTGRRPSSS